MAGVRRNLLYKTAFFCGCVFVVIIACLEGRVFDAIALIALVTLFWNRLFEPLDQSLKFAILAKRNN